MRNILLVLFIVPSLFAEGISYSQVTKVKSDDALNIRAASTHKSEKIASIPFDAQCVKNHGCGKDINLEVLMHMQEEEVKIFFEQAKEGWCYLEYKGKFGWANQYYLSPSKADCK